MSHLGPIWPTLDPNVTLKFPWQKLSVHKPVYSVVPFEIEGCKHLQGLTRICWFIHEIRLLYQPLCFLIMTCWSARAPGLITVGRDLGPKWVRLAPKGTNPGIFFRSDSLHFGISSQNVLNRSQNVMNLIWKNPVFVPFGANLTHFGPNSGDSA